MPEFSFTPVDFDPFADKDAEKKAREYAASLPETPAPSEGVLGDIATHTGGAYSPYTPFLVAGSMAKGLVDSVGAVSTLIDRVKSGEVDVMHGGNEDVAKEALNAGLLTLGGGMARAGLHPVVEPNALGIFAGQTARRLPIGSVENKFLGPEGLPRYEISDYGASLTPQMQKYLEHTENSRTKLAADMAPTKLSEAIDHPELFEAYPEFKDLPLEMDGKGGAGWHVPAQKYGEPGTIGLAPTLTPTESLTTTLHEIQHVVQHREGFARGGNPEMFTNPEMRKAIDPILKERDALARKKFADRESWTPEEQARYEELNDKYLSLNFEHQKWKNEQYRKLRGEVESRTVEARTKLQPEHWSDALGDNFEYYEPALRTEDVPRGQQNILAPYTPPDAVRIGPRPGFGPMISRKTYDTVQSALGLPRIDNAASFLERNGWTGNKILNDGLETKMTRFEHPEAPGHSIFTYERPSGAMEWAHTTGPGNSHYNATGDVDLLRNRIASFMPGVKFRSTGIPVPGLSGVTVDNSKPVPYGAGADSSRDDHVHIDSRIPEYHSGFVSSKTGEPLSLYKYLAIHELAEKPMMERLIRNGMTEHQAYLHAHYGAATPAERTAVEADGGDWAKYEEIMDGYLSKTEKESLKGASSSLYVKPYPHSKEKMKELAGHHLAGKEGAPE